DDDRNKYNTDDLTYLLPNYFSNSKDRFRLFRYKKDVPDNDKEWIKLVEIEAYYKSNRFSYKMQENSGVLYYTEYCNETEIENIVFGEPEYGCIFKSLESKVLSLDELQSDMKKVYPDITEERLKEMLLNLRNAYLIYFNIDYSNIVSVIEL
ncbi:MAG: hypothetical protein KAS62_03425, partial [Candidatus Delongbacteria bacterium]|nr:hypothetical protein [Candidatus Delongbacteria bacterium]